MQMVLDLEGVFTLAFDNQGRFGDQRLENTLGLLVASPEGFVCEQKTFVLHVGVELAGQLRTLCKRQIMTSKKAAETVGEYALAGTHGAA